MIRGFVAVQVKGMSEIEHLAKEMGRIRGIKAVRAENIHLTLKFLGNIDEDREVPELERLLSEVAKRHEPFSVKFSGTGAFPNLKRMRVAWIGIQGNELSELAEDILETLPKKQDEKPQSFRAHLTIGRVKYSEGAARGRRLLEDHAEHDFGTLHVRSFELMLSTLTPQGPIHEILSSHSLGKE